MSHDDHRVLGIAQRRDRRADTLSISGCRVVKRKIWSERAVTEPLSLALSGSQQEGSCQAPCRKQNVATGSVYHPRL